MKKNSHALSALALALSATLPATAWGAIPAAHVYHNHMPNFWPFYAVDVGAKYNATAVGAPIRYTYDAQVINLKLSPPSGYPYYLPTSAGGGIMPHDDLVSYYSHNAKTGAYQTWPMQVANELKNFSGNKGQIHVTMSGSVVNNVQDLNTLQNVPGYTTPNWGASWQSNFNSLNTLNNFKGLDLIHFTGHHTMGPLVGPEYFLKDLIYQNATLAQSYFLGSSFKSSKGFFPTELGFSVRLVPTLAKLGIQWSVLGNNHLSRTLQDYPYDTYYPTKDTLISPPNRADLRNTSNVGAWVVEGMAHEQQQIVNKFPFASTPHWVRHVDPTTGAVTKVAGIPVDQNGSWEEGWDGSTTVNRLLPYESVEPRQFSVVAHDGDNSSGRAGSLDTWQNGYSVTCSGSGYCLGIDEYLLAKPIPANDIVHVQDGSWVDTRDSSSDPQWHHWKLPFSIWKGQFPVFNTVNGTNLAPKKNLDGIEEGMTVSYEYGFHYLERNFALLQAALNYAKTAEQIWLQNNPNHWSPTTAMDNQITHPGNQLNPWMISYPVKGNAANNYAGGANPAELAWYFLLPAMDSGFGYYDENKDDHVKGTLAFNNSLYFSKPYVTSNITSDQTGPSVWWPQRWPYNPGSVNGDKSQGWTVHHYNNVFSVYTYAFDVSNISNIVVKIRPHTYKTISNSDDTYKVYDPAALVGTTGLSITPANVGAWVSYPMTRRDLRPVMNGVAWNKVNMDTMAVLPAQEIGDLYYSYISDYRDQLVDYYVEATDSRGNVTKSEIQQVYVGAGRYNKVGSKWVEDINGATEGTYPFLVIDNDEPSVPGTPSSPSATDRSINLAWTAATDNVAVTGYEIYRDGVKVGTSATTSYVDTGLTASTTYSYTVLAYDAAQNKSSLSAALSATTQAPDTVAPSAPGTPTSSAVTSASVSLAWTAATDNYGVSSYDVYRNGVKVGSSAGLTYVDNALQPSTAYSYTVKALDAAGNASAASGALNVTTSAGNMATIYYQANASWTTVNIHYQPTGGSWTTVPGVAMDAACTGWKVKQINLGSATGLAAVFNNGSGAWDNKGGQNYSLGNGISAVANGAVTSGNNPCSGDTVAPSAPTNVAGTATGSSSVSLTWTAATDNVGVVSYSVLRNGTQIATTTGLAYSDNTAAASTTYSYTVKALDAAGNVSAASAAASVTTPAQVDSQAPSVPPAPTASNITTSGVTLSWAASTDNVGVNGYQIFRDGVQVATTAATMYTDSSLTLGTTYSYTVKATDAAGNVSAASPATSVTTLSASNSATVYYQPNAAWTTVNIHYQPTGGAWTAVPGVAMDAACTGWRKKVINLGSASGLKVVFNNGSGTWDNNGGQNYSLGTGNVKVSGGVAGTGNPCAAADSVAPSTPSGLTQGATTATSMAISWTAATDNVGVTAYDVFRGSTKVATVTGTSYTDNALAPSTSYSYTVVAIDAAGNRSTASSALSASTSADTTAPSVPGSVTGSGITSTSFNVGWAAASDNVGVTAYDVQVGSTVTRVTGTSTGVSGLTASTAYQVSVRSVDAAGNVSAYSTPITVTTAGSGVVVNFKITATTTVGQNLYVVGNRAELSNWNSAAGVPCTTTSATYPVWTCQAVTLPAGTAVEYKYIKRNGTTVTWLSGANNTLTTPASGSVTINDTWR